MRRKSNDLSSSSSSSSLVLGRSYRLEMEEVLGTFDENELLHFEIKAPTNDPAAWDTSIAFVDSLSSDDPKFLHRRMLFNNDIIFKHLFCFEKEGWDVIQDILYFWGKRAHNLSLLVSITVPASMSCYKQLILKYMRTWKCVGPIVSNNVEVSAFYRYLLPIIHI